MAKFFVINDTRVGTQVHRPGDTVDDEYNDVATIRSNGGLLWPVEDSTVALAAQEAVIRRLKGDYDQTSPMLAAVCNTLDQDVQAVSEAVVEAATNAVTTDTVLSGAPLCSANSALARVAKIQSGALSKTFVGFAKDGAPAGEKVPYQTSGFLPASVVPSIGTGATRVVGIRNNSVAVLDMPDGSEIRIGVADQFGNLAVGSQYHVGTTPWYVVNVKADPYNAKGDGVTDDTAAFNAAIAAIKARGIVSHGAAFTLYVPPGDYRIEGTIYASDMMGFGMEGEEASRLLGYGPSSVPIMHLHSLYHPYLKGINFVSVTAKAVQLQVSSKKIPRTYVSTGGTFINCLFQCNFLETEICVRFGGDITPSGDSADANNDCHTLLNCFFANYTDTAIQVEDTQAFSVRAIQCRAIGNFTTTSTGAISAGSPNLTDSSARFTTARDAGKTIEVPGAGVGGGLLRATIVTAVGTAVVLDRNASTTVGPTAIIRYGAQCAMRGGNRTREKQGSIFSFSGLTGNHLGATFYVGTTGTGTHFFTDINDEGSRVFLKTDGPAYGVEKGVTISGCRIAGDYFDANYECMVYGFGGSLCIRSTAIGDPGTGRPSRILYNPGSPPNGSYKSFVIDDVTIDSTFAPHLIWTASPPTHVYNLRQFSYPYVVAPDVSPPIVHGQPAFDLGELYPTEKIDWGHSSTLKGTLAGSATWTFEGAIGLGETLRLIVDYGAGVGPITWPGSVSWVNGVAPKTGVAGTRDIFAFSYDGTTYWGSWIGQRVSCTSLDATTVNAASYLAVGAPSDSAFLPSTGLIRAIGGAQIVLASLTNIGGFNNIHITTDTNDSLIVGNITRNTALAFQTKSTGTIAFTLGVEKMIIYNGYTQMNQPLFIIGGAEPATPSAGNAYLFVNGGVLKWKGSDGIVHPL